MAGSKGRILVDKYMRVKGTNGSIISLGDCSEIEGLPLPATGQVCSARCSKHLLRPPLLKHLSPLALYLFLVQVAAQEGAYVGRLLSRGFDLEAPIPRYPIENGK